MLSSHSIGAQTTREEIGDPDRISQVMRHFGMHTATPDYIPMLQIIDGTADLAFEFYGPEKGRLAQMVISNASPPRGLAAETNAAFAIDQVAAWHKPPT